MRPVTNGLYVSRRNLLGLLAKLDGHPPDSACEIVFNFPGAAPFHLYAEEDDVHYAHPSREGYGPGSMHEDTEATIRGITQAEFRASQTFPIAAAREYASCMAHREFPPAVAYVACPNCGRPEDECIRERLDGNHPEGGCSCP